MARIFGTSGSDLRAGTNFDDQIVGWANGEAELDTGSDTLSGLGGDDQIDGGGGGDVLSGGDGNDSLEDDLDAGPFGNDLLSGGGDRDFMISNGGRDTLDGGADDDFAIINRGDATADLSFVVIGGAAVTTLVGDGTRVRNVEDFSLEGGSGDDTFTTLRGFDDLEGGAGDDALSAGGNDDDLRGGAGNDVLNGGGGEDRLFDFGFFDFGADRDNMNGGSGDDGLNSYGGIDKLNGGTGDDRATIDRSDAIFGLLFNMTDVNAFTTLAGNGTRVKNVERLELYGGGGNDKFATLGGEDRLDGNGGGDQLSGGGGDDNLGGGDGNDILAGGAGGDSLYGDDAASQAHGDDILIGGAGDDYLNNNGGGVDTFNGGTGYDQAYIFRGDVSADLSFIMTSTESFTTLLGDGTRVKAVEQIDIVGGVGDDVFVTLGGNDLLSGNDGSDTLDAGGGDDTLDAGGASAPRGDRATDILRFSGNFGADVVFGFQDKQDHIEFTGFTEDDLTIARTGRSVILTLDNGTDRGSVVIEGFGFRKTFDGDDYSFV